jgi:hypothetical protein
MKEPTEYLHQAVVIFMQRSQFLYISLIVVTVFWAKALVLLCCHKPRAKAQGNSCAPGMGDNLAVKVRYELGSRNH